MENWKRIDMYEVSDDGQVFSHYTGRTLKLIKDKKGYYRICIYRDGARKSCLVHRLVYEAFVGEIPEGMQIDHRDGCKTNNRLENLRCVTCMENRHNPVTFNNNIEMVRKKLNKPVLQIDKQYGNVIRKWECAMDAWRETGIDYRHISECCRGTKKRKSAGGYKWCFFMPPAVI